MSFVNLTPHAIVIALPSGERATFPPSGGVARVSQLPTVPGTVGGIPTVGSPVFGAVEGLPAPDGRLFLVSGLVLGHCIGRSDVFAPATGPSDGVIRDDKGRVEAVTRLVRAPGA